jgi:transposase
MEPERIELSQPERDRLKVLHEVEQGHCRQVEAAERLRLSDRQVRRLLVRVRAEGDRGLIHRLRGRPSNRKIPEKLQQRVLARVRQRYADFGPTLATEHLAQDRLVVSRETLRKWRVAAGLWHPRRRRVKAVHVWRERRAAFGELVLWDSSPYRWLEDRGPACPLILMIDDATSRLWGRFAEHDSTEENFRVLEGWLRRHGRPLAYYTDKDSLFVINRPAQLGEQLRGQGPLTQIGRALGELGIEWIPAHSPQAKGRIENAFGTLQDRLVKEMRLAGVSTIEQANDFFSLLFVPFWERRFAVAPRSPHDAHRRLGREHRLEEILSVRVGRAVANDYTVTWNGQRWGVPRDAVCAGLRGARVEVERRLDGSHWLRFRGRSLPLHSCPAAPPAALTPSGLRPPGVSATECKLPRRKYIPPPDHPWRRPWKRTSLPCEKPDISTLR